MNESLGAAIPRIDGPAKVIGAAEYPADRIPSDALWAFAVFTDQPHARLQALDASAASVADGVVAVLTAEDVPVNEFGLTMFDQPVLIGTRPSPGAAVDTTVSRWEADRLAIVIAATHAQARAAAALLVAEWEQLPLVPDMDTALAGATLVHEEAGSNGYVRQMIRKGDIARGETESHVVVEGSYALPYQEHAYLQPEAGLAYIDDEGRVTVEIAGQWTHEDREQIAHALDLALDRVRVIYPAIGGAFGGREDMSLQIVLALAAKHLSERGIARPVAMQWSREESIVGHHKRHRGRIDCRWGAQADGRITFVEADIFLDAGAYNCTTNKVLGNCALTVAGPYEVPHARIDAVGVYTSNVPTGAFRGFGAPQGCFAAEGQIEKLADALGIDPVEIRRVNAVREGSIGITQTELPAGVSLPEVIDACAAAARTRPPTPDPFSPFATLPAASDRIRTGRGFAAAYKNIGFSFGYPERCEATIVLHEEDGAGDISSVELFHAGAEVGQGAHTALVQMAAAAVGVPVDLVRPTFSDTATSGDSGSASASRLTWMGGNAILGAAEEADKAWRAGDRPAVGHFRFVPPPTEPLPADGGPSATNFAYGYAAQSVELSVDLDTGHVVVHRVVSAHDVGRVVNRDLVLGQIEGAIVQAHGYALTEDLQVRDGRILNPRLSGYLMPGILDIPERIEAVILELADPRGPWGLRGVAEMPLIPYAPAVAAALHDATGVWFDALPLTPDRVLARLQESGVVA